MNDPRKKKPDSSLVNYGAADDVKTFSEAKDIIKTRLKYLRVDLGKHSPMEDSLVAEITMAHEDKRLSLMDFYSHLYSPCKVSDLAFVPKGQGDMNDVMIDFSEGYDKFIKSMEEEYVAQLIRRRNATILLSKMLSIKYPYSKIMYLYYYKAMTDIEIADSLYISRATFYRIKDAGLTILTSMYYPTLEIPRKKK